MGASRRVAWVCLVLVSSVVSTEASEVSRTPIGGLEIDTLHKLAPSDAGERDSFSSSVDISGDTLVSSAREDDNENGEDSGSVYVLERDPETGLWAESAKLLAFDGEEHDYYGESVAIGGDIVAVGTDRKRAVYVYERDLGGPDDWGLLQKLLAPPDSSGTEFGWEVDLSDDGLQLAVASLGKQQKGGVAGFVYIYERVPGGDFEEVARLEGSDAIGGDQFGFSMALRASGGRLVTGAYLKDERRGRAYVFEDDGAGTWAETGNLISGDVDIADHFGIAASIWDDTIVIGASHDSDVADRAGAAYVFELESTTGAWLETAKLAPFDAGPIAFFGRCLMNKNNIISVAAPGDDDFAVSSGANYLYRRDQGGDGTWGFVYKTSDPDSEERDRYGYSLAMDGDDLIIGADRDLDENGVESGTLYTYTVKEESFLAVHGVCPGQVSLTIAHAGANGRVMVAIGDGPGETVLGGGACAGAVLGLENARTFTPVGTNVNGGTELDRTVPAGLCGKSLQVLDLSNCRTSNIIELPGS